MKFWKTVPSLVALSVASIAQSAIISVDDMVFGVDSVTQDSESGLEWLDVNLSVRRSFFDISSQFGIGGDYEGFRYAIASDFNTLFDNIVKIAGNDSNLTRDDINSVGSAVDPYIEMLGTTGDSAGYPNEIQGLINKKDAVGRIAWYGVHGSQQYGGPRFYGGSTYSSTAHTYIGSWLVREISPVPIPAAAWLFGTALLALLGLRNTASAA